MSNKIDLFLFDTSKVKSHVCYNSYLSMAELKAYDSLSSSKRRKEFVLSRYLIRKLLDITSDIEFMKNPNGKLYIDPGQEFNITHSQNYIVCAIGDEKPVGVDIERIDKKNAYLEISQKYFHIVENKFIRSESDKSAQQLNFLKLWTLKESMFKLFGLKFTKENSKLFFDFDKLKVIAHPGLAGDNNTASVFIEYKDLYLSCSVLSKFNNFSVNFMEVFAVENGFLFSEIKGSNYKLRTLS